MENKDRSAYPLTDAQWTSRVGRGIKEQDIEGLTKREYFAGLALQGLCSNLSGNQFTEEIASDAVEFADALLKALEKPQ